MGLRTLQVKLHNFYYNKSTNQKNLNKLTHCFYCNLNKLTRYI